jgi:hypothetical protein
MVVSRVYSVNIQKQFNTYFLIATLLGFCDGQCKYHLTSAFLHLWSIFLVIGWIVQETNLRILYLWVLQLSVGQRGQVEIIRCLIILQLTPSIGPAAKVWGRCIWNNKSLQSPESMVMHICTSSLLTNGGSTIGLWLHNYNVIKLLWCGHICVRLLHSVGFCVI